MPTVHLPTPHRGQLTILKNRSRFRVVACGRRFGKTELGKLLLIEGALRGGTCWWVAPTYGMAGQVWNGLKMTLAPLKQRINSTQYSMHLPGGGSITIRSGHKPDHLRGAGLDLVVLDEAAFLPATLWPEVIRPMLVERQGRGVLLSTPYGRNHFWRLFRLGGDPSEPDWAAFQFPTSANPRIDPAELDAIRRVTSERVFRSEYLAEFVDELARVFRNVAACATAPTDPETSVSIRSVAGIDWGRYHDHTAIVILEAGTRRMLALDRFTGLEWATQRERISQLCRRWNVRTIVAESNSAGSPNIEALQAEGFPVRPFNTSAQSKPALIDALAAAIEGKTIQLLPDPTLLAELEAYEITRLPGGGWRTSAPEGGHDDTVMALALALHAAGYSTRVGFA
jgi:hypothetical protein